MNKLLPFNMPPVSKSGMLGMLSGAGSSLFYEDDFSTADWTERDSAVIGIGSGVMNWDFLRNNQDDGAYDEFSENISDTAWVWRYKLSVDNATKTGGSNSIGMFYLSDINGATSSNQDHLGNALGADGAPFAIVHGDADAVNSNGSTVANIGAGLTKYIENSRLSSTSFKSQAWDNSDFTTSFGTATDVISSSIIGLDFIKVQNQKLSGSGTYDLDGSVDNYEIKNGVTTW